MRSNCSCPPPGSPSNRKPAAVGCQGDPQWKAPRRSSRTSSSEGRRLGGRGLRRPCGLMEIPSHSGSRNQQGSVLFRACLRLAAGATTSRFSSNRLCALRAAPRAVAARFPADIAASHSSKYIASGRSGCGPMFPQHQVVRTPPAPGKAEAYSATRPAAPCASRSGTAKPGFSSHEAAGHLWQEGIPDLVVERRRVARRYISGKLTGKLSAPVAGPA